MKKRMYLLSGMVLLVVCVVCIYLLLDPPDEMPPAQEVQVAKAVKEVEARKAGAPAEPEAGAESEPYISPVDFQLLRDMNEDIYAWLYIPGTDVNYPLLQSTVNDEYYMNYNSAGRKNPSGALFTQSTYNGIDLTDPVTVVYGHHLRSGAMFGNLQAIYSEPGALTEYGEILVFLPEEEVRYKVFAAAPYGSEHILAYYDFTNPADYQLFLQKIWGTRMVGANISSTVEASAEDRLLILSTCLQGNNKKRYLVFAVRTDSSAATDDRNTES